MNIILLSGGSGKRLWPLSNEIRSKQFLKLFADGSGGVESMAQRMTRGIKKAAPDARIIFATSKTQVASLRQQLEDDIEISVEPMRRDTFPAIALSCLYLRDIKKVSEDEAVVICPIDPFVDDAYFEALVKLYELAEQTAIDSCGTLGAADSLAKESRDGAALNGEKNEQSDGANLFVMGIAPTYPSEKYGYILPKKQQTKEIETKVTETAAKKTDYKEEYKETEIREIYGKETKDNAAGDKERVEINPDGEETGEKETLIDVESFKEKPDVKTAESYIARGALWNGGVFVFKLKYICDKARVLTGCKSYEEMLTRYDELEKISFDYAVAEKEPHIKALRYAGSWKDLGTWNTLTESMSVGTLGRVVMDDTCKNTHAINELDTPLLCMGLRDAVVVASPDGMLVADKHESSYMKPYVDEFTDPARYALKDWGEYRVIAGGERELVIRVTLTPGNKMHYHSHKMRDESWTVISGEGEAVIDGERISVKKGSVVAVPRGARHTLIAHTLLTAIEVQSGDDIDVNDKEVYEL